MNMKRYVFSIAILVAGFAITTGAVFAQGGSAEKPKTPTKSNPHPKPPPSSRNSANRKATNKKTDSAKKEETVDNSDAESESPAPPINSVVEGQKMNIKGTVVWHKADIFVFRDANGINTGVRITEKTIFRKKGGTQSGQSSSASQIHADMKLDVEGRGDSTGYLVAEKIFSENE